MKLNALPIASLPQGLAVGGIAEVRDTDWRGVTRHTDKGMPIWRLDLFLLWSRLGLGWLELSLRWGWCHVLLGLGSDRGFGLLSGISRHVVDDILDN